MVALVGEVQERREGQWRTVLLGESVRVNDRRRVSADGLRYRCATCKTPIIRGDRCTCGRGWFVELVP